MRARAALLVFAALAPSAAGAQGGGDAHAARPVVAAARLDGAVRVDGRLTERAWAGAEPAAGFTQSEPRDGEPATERTDVRVLVGEDALYVGARMHDRRAGTIRRRLTRRDDPAAAASAASDAFVVSLDPFHDHRTGVRFTVTPAGSLADAAVAQSQPPDASWDAVWEARTTVDAEGWTAEIRIPLSQLRYARGGAERGGGATWGVQFERFILRLQERDLFAYVPRGDRAGVERYGHLTGLGRLPASRRLEVLPYTAQRATHLGSASASALASGVDHRSRAGVDLEYAPGGGLSLAATVNPDFGQVEVDPAVVNLTTIETRFPERRPFFVEGSNAFAFGRLRAYNFVQHPTAFFSRRVGRPPQLRPPDARRAVATLAPAQSEIAVASKLTGRTAGGWSVGALHARTREALGRSLLGDGAVREGVVEPASDVGVARVVRDFRGGMSSVGGIVTAVERDLDDATRPLLRSSATAGGLDLAHAWGGHGWALDASALWSTVRGSASAIELAQRSRVHYFQRPDARHGRLDPARTALGGAAGQAAVTRLRGRWVGSLAYQDVSPGFEGNDLGYQGVAGRRALSTDLHYQRNDPGRVFLNYIIWPFTTHLWSYDGDRIRNVPYNDYNFWLQGQLRNFWQVILWEGYNPRAVDDRLTRGGPAALSPSSWWSYAELRSDERRAYAAALTASRERDDLGGHATTVSAALTWRPGSSARLRLEPSLTDRRDAANFVQYVPDPGAPATRALFATLDRTTLALDTRLDWTFTPRLTLQLYAQPLVDAGTYAGFKELRAPRTLDFVVRGRDVGSLPYEIPSPDFGFRSLRGNVVLRWEYRPGSTLYVAWQQQREATAAAGDFALGRDLRSLARIPADDVLLVKASYWLGL